MIFVLFFHIIASYVYVVKFIKKKEWRELFIFSSFQIVAIALSLLYLLDVAIPSPIRFLQYIIVDVMKIKYP